jgi:DNA-binding NtrC family response regulator
VEKQRLRLLIVDDSLNDVQVTTAALCQAAYQLESQHVRDLAGFQVALEKSTYDLVISEYVLSDFGAAVALDALKRAGMAYLPALLMTSISLTSCARERVT